jgi:hypothetical protein
LQESWKNGSFQAKLPPSGQDALRVQVSKSRATGCCLELSQGRPALQRCKMAIIGILTSTTLTNDLRTAFELGFGAAAPTYAHNSPREAAGHYDARGVRNKNLYRAVNVLNKQSGAGMDGADIIVAVGGVGAAHAVVKRSQKPFLVVIGQVPDAQDFSLEDNDNYLGGVDLHSTNSNLQRAATLMDQFPGAITAAKQVHLLYNSNSRTGSAEAKEWTSHGFTAVPAVLDNEENSTADFAAAFDVMRRKSAKGAVISADPYFSNQKGPLVAAANMAAGSPGAGGFNLKICYPFDYYSSATPTAGSGMYVGPKLSEAYKLVGRKAKTISDAIDAGNSLDFQGLDLVPWMAKPIT